MAEAQRVVGHIIDQARADGGGAVAVAVVDAAGRLRSFAAMDHVMPASIKLAQSKAYSAVVGQRDTAAWATFPKQEKVVDFDMRNWTDANFSGFTGGVVVRADGHVLGGIGVSGRKGTMDAADTLMQDNELALCGQELLYHLFATNGTPQSA